MMKCTIHNDTVLHPNVGLTIVCQNYRNITIRNKEKCNNSKRF